MAKSIRSDIAVGALKEWFENEDGFKSLVTKTFLMDETTYGDNIRFLADEMATQLSLIEETLEVQFEDSQGDDEALRTYLDIFGEDDEYDEE